MTGDMHQHPGLYYYMLVACGGFQPQEMLERKMHVASLSEGNIQNHHNCEAGQGAQRRKVGVFIQL